MDPVAPKPKSNVAVHDILMEDVDLAALGFESRAAMLCFETAVNLLVNEGWRRISRYYLANCCILATRVADELFEHAGIEHRPTVCQAVAYNHAFMTASRDLLGRLPKTEEEGRLILGVEGAEGSGVLYAPSEDPDYFGGHVVSLATDPLGRKWLIDLSAPQMARRHLPITDPVLGRVEDNWLDGEHRAVFEESREKIMFTYLAIPEPDEDHDYADSESWNDPGRPLIVQSLIRKYDKRTENLTTGVD